MFHACEARLEISGKKSPPIPHPLKTRGGGGETQPNKNCAKKRRIGNSHGHLRTRLKTDKTSETSPLAIEVRDGQEKPQAN